MDGPVARANSVPNGGANSSLVLDRASEVPLHRQLTERLRHAIRTGSVPGGTRLLPSRDLASSLGVSRNTVIHALDQLTAEGYLEARPGAGTFVKATLASAAQCRRVRNTKHAPSQRAARMLAQAPHVRRYDPTTAAFRPCIPALDAFPVATWRRLASRALRLDAARLNYADPAGHRPLREAIAHHLRQTRGITLDADHVVIVEGAQAALALIASVLLDAGNAAWVEDPGYGAARAVLAVYDARVVPVPVDEQGLDVARARRLAPRAKLAYVTPSHQYPMGYTMSLSRRLELLAWASASDAFVVEDDYDSEFRFAGHTLPSLQALDDDGRVIYVGTFSKVLAPSLRVGYLIVPDRLLDYVQAARATTSLGAPTMEQAILAAFIQEGHFARHIRRMTALYEERYEALLRFVERYLGDRLRPVGAPMGMHVTALLDTPIEDRALSGAAGRAGLVLPSLSEHRIGASGPSGVVMGFATNDPVTLCAAVRRLAAVMRELAPEQAVVRHSTAQQAAARSAHN